MLSEIYLLKLPSYPRDELIPSGFVPNLYEHGYRWFR